jgi:hypothetical protein
MTTVALDHTHRFGTAAGDRGVAHSHEDVVALPERVRTRLTRRGRVVLAAVIVLPLLIGGGVLAAGSGAMAGVQAPSGSFHHLTVQPGDSLWTIAERVAPHSDPRDVVSAFVDLNGLSTSVVQAGEQLAIPHEYDRAGH